MSERIKLIQGTGKSALNYELTPVGNDWLILLTGGDAHIGCTAIGDDGRLSSYTPQSHKDDALAIPLAAAGQVLTIIVRTITVAFQHAADKAAENGNLTALSWIHVSSLFLQAMRIAIPAVIVAISVGTSEVQSMLNAIPEVVTGGLNIAGGMIVVVGYAMVINMMRAGYLMPFFYLGFVTAAFTNFNLVALGVIGAVMAILYIQLSPKYNRVAGAPAQAAGNNDLDNELD